MPVRRCALSQSKTNNEVFKSGNPGPIGQLPNTDPVTFSATSKRLFARGKLTGSCKNLQGKHSHRKSARFSQEGGAEGKNRQDGAVCSLIFLQVIKVNDPLHGVDNVRVDQQRRGAVAQNETREQLRQLSHRTFCFDPPSSFTPASSGSEPPSDSSADATQRCCCVGGGQTVL